MNILNIVLINLHVIFVILPILLAIAFMTIAERRLLAIMQRRQGPMEVGYYGVLQPFADALKLILKETVIPSHSNKILFYLAPVSTLVLSLLGWAIIPFGQGLFIFDYSLGILYTLALSSLGVTGVISEDSLNQLNIIKLYFVYKRQSLNYNKTLKRNSIVICHKIKNKHYILRNRLNKRSLFFLEKRALQNLIQIRSYSTNNLKILNYSLHERYTPLGTPLGAPLGEEFIHWFSGFCDAESYFYISEAGYNFRFIFGINLHIDDLKVLLYIKEKLGIGKIYTSNKIVTLRITKYKELQIILNILEIRPLNTSKYLNYLAFKEGLLLYNNRYNLKRNLSLNDKILLFNKIRSLKNSMNSFRTDFIFPKSHKIIITPYWLLGFVEGDGSFSVSTSPSISLRFNIVQTKSEQKVLEAIRFFLLELIGEIKLRTIKSNPIQIIENFNSERDLKPKLNLNINDHSILSNILVPFFNKLNFLSKKGLDYKDWKLLLELKTGGWHLSKEGSNLIIALSKHMNNNRLSSNLSLGEVNTQKSCNEEILDYSLIINKIKNLLKQPSNFEIYPDGKIFIKSELKFWKGRGNVEIEVFNNKNLLIYSFENLDSTAKFFNVSKHIIKYRLNTGKPLISESQNENNEVYFKRAIKL